MSALETTKLGSFVWRLEPGFRIPLERDVAALLAGRAEQGVALLKRTRVREVWRVERSPGFFVKRYLSPTSAVGIRARLRGSKAQREADTAAALTAKGLATVRPLAVGERQGPGLALESILVTQAIDHRGDLATSLTDPVAAGVSRRRLLLRFGGYLAQLHDEGVDHRDLHGENLLLLDSPDPRFALIDLDGVSLHRSLSKRRRARSLARVLHALRDVTGRSDRLRVLRAYLDAAGLRDEEAAFRNAIDRGWQRERRRTLRSGTRRALRIGSRFDQLHDASRSLYWRRSVGRETVERVLEAHAETVRSGSGEFLKRSRRVRVTLQDVGAPQRFVVKESFDPSLWTRLRNTLFGSRGRTAWVAGHHLDFLGFGTATTVALLERKQGRLVGESLIVTVALDDMVPLSTCFKTQFSAKPLAAAQVREKRTLSCQVARLLRRLHVEGIHHHDLSARNVFVATAGDPREIAILDLESVRKRPLTRRRRAVNLCQLLETLGANHWTDTRRFLRDYGIRDAAERQRWLERVDALARRRKRRRKRRSAKRPLPGTGGAA